MHPDFVYSRPAETCKFLNDKQYCSLLGNCPSIPSLTTTLTLSSHLGRNGGSGEGQVGSFPETYNAKIYPVKSLSGHVKTGLESVVLYAY